MASSNVQELLRLLSSMGSGGSRQTPSLADLMSRPAYKPVDPSLFSGFKFPEKKQGPSFLSRVFDVLSRPLYTVAEPLRMAIEPGSEDPLEYLGGAWKGLSGQAKTRGKDVAIALDQRVNDNSKLESTRKFENLNPYLKFGTSLGLDIGLDPLTYINPFSIASKFRAPVQAAKEFEGAQTVSRQLLESSTAPNISNLSSRAGRYENAGDYKSVLSSLDARAASGFKAPNAMQIPRNNNALMRSTLDPKITGITAPTPNSMRLPNGSEIPLGPSPSNARNLTPNNVIQDLLNPLRESNMSTRMVTPERIPTPNEMNFEIPAAFRSGAPPQIPMPLPRTDFGLPQTGPRASLTAPESAFSPEATTAMGNLEYMKSIDPTVDDIFRGNDLYRPGRLLTDENVQAAGFKNLGFARNTGERQMSRIEREIAENAGPMRTARGFQEYRASRQAGMPYPEASRIIEDIASGGARPVLRDVDQTLADDIARQAIDDISKGGKTSPSGSKTWYEFGTREQANTWNTIRSRLTAAGQTRGSSIDKATYRIMQSIEDQLIAVGYQPMYRAGKGAPSRSMRLTSVIDELGGPGAVSANHMTEVLEAFARRNPSILKSPEAREAMERVITRDYRNAVSSVERAVNKASIKNSIAEQVLSPGAIAKWRRENLVPYMEHTMRGEGASVSAVSSARKIIDQLNKAKVPVREKLSKAERDILNGAMKRGSYSRKTADVTAAQMRNLGQQLDVQWKQLGEVIGEGSMAGQALRSTVAAHYGMGNVRALFNSEVQQGIAQSTLKANYLASIAKNYSKTEINEAWRGIQGFGDSTDPRIFALQRELEQTINTLVSPVGVSSVAKSSMTLQKDLNEALRRLGEKFQFSKDANHVDEFGRTHNFSQNDDWLTSWKTAKTEEPLEFLLKVDTALEQITHRYSAYDNLAARYGSRKHGAEYRYKVPQIERLNGYYFPKDIAERLVTLHKSLNDLYSPQSPIMKHFDNVMTALKAGMTIYTPSHHIRNMIGDIFNSWIAGVNSVRPYNQAARVLGSQRSRYKEYPGIRELVNDDAMRNALTRRRDIITRNKSNTPFTAEQLYLGAFDRGLLQSASSREELVGKQLMPKILGGRVQNVARTTSELRDHEMRLAHFIDIVNKSKGQNVPEIFEKAAMEVRKWHPDGLDLTAFEKRYMRRIFPFYSWTRKAVPLMVEAVAKKPGKVMMYPKGMSALQQSLGIESDGVSNPFPGDQLFPEWIREKGIGPIGDAAIGGPLGALGQSQTNMFGDERGYNIVNPSNPFIDISAQFGGMGRPSDPIQGAMQMLNPFLKVPYELNQGKESLTGQPIEGREADYWSKQIPIFSAISRITNSNISGGPNARGEEAGRFNQEAFLNWLTAAGIIGTGRYETSAEIEEKLGGKR